MSEQGNDSGAGGEAGGQFVQGDDFYVQEMKLTRWQHQCVDVEADPALIPEQEARIPGMIAYWNASYAEAVGAWRAKEKARKETYARVRRELRSRKAGGEKLTADDMDGETILDPRYMQAKAEEDAAEVQALKVGAWCKAVDAKRNMLASIGAMLRNERDAL